MSDLVQRQGNYNIASETHMKQILKDESDQVSPTEAPVSRSRSRSRSMTDVCSSTLPDLYVVEDKCDSLKDNRDNVYGKHPYLPPIELNSRTFLSGNGSTLRVMETGSTRGPEKIIVTPKEEDNGSDSLKASNISNKSKDVSTIKHSNEREEEKSKKCISSDTESGSDYYTSLLTRRESITCLKSSSGNSTFSQKRIFGVSEPVRIQSLYSRHSTPNLNLSRRLSKTNINDFVPEGTGRPRSRSTNVPPLLKSNAYYRYPMAARYLKRWYSQIKSSGKESRNELENLKEDFEDDSSGASTFELLSKFPSSPEFAQVLHDICKEVCNSDEP